MDKIFTFINDIVNRTYVKDVATSFKTTYAYIIAFAFAILMASMILGLAASAKKARVFSVIIALLNLVLPLAMVYTVVNFAAYRDANNSIGINSFSALIDLFKTNETAKLLLIVAAGEVVINLLSFIYICILASRSNKGLAALAIILYVIKFFALPALPFVIYIFVPWTYVTPSIQYLYLAGVCGFMFLTYLFLLIGVASKNNQIKKIVVGVNDLFTPVYESVEEDYVEETVEENEEVAEENTELPPVEEESTQTDGTWN